MLSLAVAVEVIALLSSPANQQEWRELLQETDEGEGLATPERSRTRRSRQPQRRLERAEVAALVEAYQSGTGCRSPARYGLHRNSVRDILRRQGVPPRQRGSEPLAGPRNVRALRRRPVDCRTGGPFQRSPFDRLAHFEVRRVGRRRRLITISQLTATRGAELPPFGTTGVVLRRAPRYGTPVGLVGSWSVDVLERLHGASQTAGSGGVAAYRASAGDRRTPVRRTRREGAGLAS